MHNYAAHARARGVYTPPHILYIYGVVHDINIRIIMFLSFMSDWIGIASCAAGTAI